MGETRVDLLHLLEDLRDAYTGSLEDTILTEVIANSLPGSHQLPGEDQVLRQPPLPKPPADVFKPARRLD